MNIRWWRIVVVGVLTATAAWSWASLREDRATQVKAHSVFAFTDQFGQPGAGYRVRFCTTRVAWRSWLFPWHPYGFEQRNVIADDRGDVRVAGRHRYLGLRELGRQPDVSWA